MESLCWSVPEHIGSWATFLTKTIYSLPFFDVYPPTLFSNPPIWKSLFSFAFPLLSGCVDFEPLCCPPHEFVLCPWPSPCWWTLFFGILSIIDVSKKLFFSESFTKNKIVIGASMWAEFVGGWGHQGGLTHVSAHILCVYIQISTPFFSLFAAFRTSICCKPAQWNTQQINWKAFIVELQPYAVAALSSLLMAAIPSLFVPRLFRPCQGLNRAVHVWAPLNRAIL